MGFCRVLHKKITPKQAIISLILSTIGLFYGFFLIGSNLPATKIEYKTENICQETRFYDLGTFDTHFNITKDYFLSAVAAAESVWEDYAGYDLFSYKPGASFVLNLVYDEQKSNYSKEREPVAEPNGTESEDVVGEYIANAINVYQFDGYDDLVGILAHELGHALGLNHAETDAGAVMSPYLDYDLPVVPYLTEEDVALFKSACEISVMVCERDCLFE